MLTLHSDIWVNFSKLKNLDLWKMCYTIKLKIIKHNYGLIARISALKDALQVIDSMVLANVNIIIYSHIELLQASLKHQCVNILLVYLFVLSKLF